MLETSGTSLLGIFALPEAAWWDEYYGSLEARLRALRCGQYAGNALAQAILDSTQQQIDLYREYSDCYGYVFYVLKKRLGEG